MDVVFAYSRNAEPNEWNQHSVSSAGIFVVLKNIFCYSLERLSSVYKQLVSVIFWMFSAVDKDSVFHQNKSNSATESHEICG